MDKMQVIVSLTTISSRINQVHDTILSILGQVCEFDIRIQLNISREAYLLDQGITDLPPELAQLSTKYRNFRINWVPNTGPYRKLLPVLDECLRSQSNPIIITCDDDVIYPTNFVQTLVSAHLRSNAIVAYRGYTIQLHNGEIQPYRAWQLAPKKKISVLNIPTGKDGILYRPAFFDQRITNLENFQNAAPTADDLWFKWHTALRSIPVLLLSTEGAPELPNNDQVDFEISLYSQFNKTGGNDVAVANLERLLTSAYEGPLASLLETQSLLELLTVENLRDKSFYAIRTGNFKEAKQLQRAIDVARYMTAEEAGRSGLNVSRFAGALTSIVECRANETKAVSRSYGGAGMDHVRRVVGEFDRSYGWMSTRLFEGEKSLVSVVMTTFNAEATIEWAAESILCQDYFNIELIVVDDCSSDGTLKILRRLAAKDNRLKFFSLPKNRGTYFCKNLGILESNGKYIAFQDSDDFSHPARIRLQLWHLIRSNKSAARCSYVRQHARKGDLVAVNGSVESLGYITLIVPRSTFDEVGYFDCARKAADDEMLRRIKGRFGTNAIDDFALPAYLALYDDNSLIADSSEYDAVSGLRFRLSTERASYLAAFEDFHAKIELAAGSKISLYYTFPPTAINIPKPSSIASFSLEELSGLEAEVEVARSSFEINMRELN